MPVAAVEVDNAIAPADLLTWLRERLPAYQVPVEIMIVGQLPRTPSMKIGKPGIAEISLANMTSGNFPGLDKPRRAAVSSRRMTRGHDREILAAECGCSLDELLLENGD